MLFLDSASVEDARAALRLGYVAGVTTNPALMSAAGADPLARLAELLDAFPTGPVFYQPASPEAAGPEVERALEVGPERVVIKLPARADLYGIAAGLVGSGATVAITAVYSAAQAVAAAGVGAAWVIAYVDRAGRLMGEVGEDLVAELAIALEAVRAPTRIVGGSIKDPDQAVATLRAGAHAITAPLRILEAMADHPLSRRAIEEFREA